jgi:hypothetical protein
MRKRLALLAFGATLAVAVIASAQQPARNVSAQKHPNLAAAQRLSQQAYDKLTAAQNANEFDLGGHASRAKELLRQANEEMKLAAMAANRR